MIPPHENVVKCHGYTTDDKGEDHIVLEWVDKEELEHLLPRLTLQDRMTILTAVAKAIAHLHDNDIVHNDIALRNILVHRTQGPIAPENIKICGKRTSLCKRLYYSLADYVHDSSLCRSWMCIFNQ